MSRYDWSNAPDWAKAAATDKDGRRNWFSRPPIQGSRVWLHGGPLEPIENSDWAESLELRPVEIDAEWPDALERSIPPLEMSA